MSLIKANSVQIGQSGTASQNFTLTTGVDGTAKLSRGNAGATTQDVLSVDITGKVTLPAGNDMIGVGQTWVNVSGSRSTGVSYQNTTGKPIQIVIQGRSTITTPRYLQVSADNTTWVDVGMFPHSDAASNIRVGGWAIVPSGHYYKVTGALDSGYLWSELR